MKDVSKKGYKDDKMDDFELTIEEMRQLFIERKKKLNIQKDLNKLKSFKVIIAEFLSIKNEYLYKRNELQSLSKEIVNFEYSKDGEAIHRGYYCPSPVLDLVIGNLKRGRILKRKPDFGKYTYEYGFDKDKRLIRVRRVNEFTTPESRFDEEYLIYNNDIVYGIEFDNMGELSRVSKCTYANGHILKYEESSLSQSTEYQDKYADLHVEEYKYINNELSEVTLFLNVSPFMERYEELRYSVQLDENNKIVKLIGGFVQNGVWEKVVFKFK